jgi:hypothetical protein
MPECEAGILRSWWDENPDPYRRCVIIVHEFLHEVPFVHPDGYNGDVHHSPDLGHIMYPFIDGSEYERCRDPSLVSWAPPKGPDPTWTQKAIEGAVWFLKHPAGEWQATCTTFRKDRKGRTGRFCTVRDVDDTVLFRVDSQDWRRSGCRARSVPEVRTRTVRFAVTLGTR